MNIVLFILILIFFTLMGFLYYRLCQRTAIEFLNPVREKFSNGVNRLKNQKQKEVRK